MLIALVRHGRTDWNEQSRIQGRQPIPVNDVGRYDIRFLLPVLARCQPQLILTSPTIRARESADVIAQELQLPVAERDALDEFDVGKWAGSTVDVLQHERRWRIYQRRRVRARPPGGESMRTLLRRVSRFVRDEISRVEDNVVIVSHAEVIRTIAGLLLELSEAQIDALACATGSLSLIRIVDRRIELLLWNYRREIDV